MQDAALPDTIEILRPDGVRLAARRQPGDGPAILFLHGLMSTMQGEKAAHLAGHARAHGREFLRYDASGHGDSGGRFADGTIGVWLDDALLACGQVRSERIVVVGSSIGGWIALLLALAHPDRIAGLVLVAPAPDMTRRVAARLPPEARQALDRDGVWQRPSRYGEPIPITRRMLEDGERHCLLHEPIGIRCPVRILHGQRDDDVPWQDSLQLAGRLAADDVQLTLVKDGDHRLSRRNDLALMTAALDALCQPA
ncbi:alpha/beta hydrolase [Lichenicoccus roseus]|uniref:Palmitoyl-protein thioesterase ABHD10, mitochondrial n=1 Tax=Lichenicoccus roseus TaxID=2683649 RepID=A0A5R9J9N7_9PROT|nr:alpha/beta hydrolase [Lichenicoccus roseus]TLU72311.1 alpha/beta hydrolase [Lichenicoccus roseus]